jgi:ribonuclease Z
MIDVALLGTGGMTPLNNRFLTSLLLRNNGRFLLIDCGEGCQITLRSLAWGFKNIDVICITHCHADHIAGLPGIILSIANSGRTADLDIIGPENLKDVFNGLMTIVHEPPFKVNIYEINDKTNTIKLSKFNISMLAVDHRVPCYAYSITKNRIGKFDKQKIENLGIPKTLWGDIQKLPFIEYDGRIYTREELLGKDRKGLKVTYCTDTRPNDNIADFAKRSDLFICEGLYGDDSKLSKAKEYKHMTFTEAANLAYKADVSELWLTHFSPSMTEPDIYINNARAIFKNTTKTYDRIVKHLTFD